MNPSQSSPATHTRRSAAALPRVLGSLLLATASGMAAELPGVTVAAGGFDRASALVEFQLPPGLNAPLELVGPDAAPVALQVEPDRRAAFILPRLARGAEITFRIRAAAAGAPQAMRAIPSATTIRLEHSGRHAFTYQSNPGQLPDGRTDLSPVFTRGGYIHPVLTPGGRMVTDDYPPNHKHHHGIWYAWTKTGFEGRSPDFWNMGDRKGTVEFIGVDRTWSGPVHAGFDARHRQVDLTGPGRRVALEETWTVRLLNPGSASQAPAHIIDVIVTDRCAGSEPVKLPKYRYGGIGLRGHRSWDGAGNMTFHNSAGTTDRSKGDNAETRGRWAHLGGTVDGSVAGIALLGHPSNPNSPQPQRIHPTEPFLCFAPQQAGDLVIEPGKPLTQRYRFVVTDGAANPVELDRLWNDYAHPPRVTVQP